MDTSGLQVAMGLGGFQNSGVPILRVIVFDYMYVMDLIFWGKLACNKGVGAHRRLAQGTWTRAA